MKDLIWNLQQQIDTIDHEFIYLLYRRFEIVKQLKHLDYEDEFDRFDSKKDDIYNEAIDKWVSKELVDGIFHLIQKEVSNIEK